MLSLKFIAVAAYMLIKNVPGLPHTSQPEPFLSFEVKPGTGGSVLIQWKTTPESDTLHFEVEKSRDKKIWEKIQHVAVQPSHDYSCTDTRPAEGLNYYRVRRVGSVERFSYSRVKWVQLGKTGTLYLWPNPAKDILHVKTPFVKGSMDIIDQGGRLVLKISITGFITDVPAARLSKGVYVIHIKQGDEMLVEKFIKE